MPKKFTVPVQWDRTNPDDRYSWDAQHELLKFMDPPYVYNVFRDDKAGFIEAIRSAMKTPIEGYEHNVAICLAGFLTSVIMQLCARRHAHERCHLAVKGCSRARLARHGKRGPRQTFSRRRRGTCKCSTSWAYTRVSLRHSARSSSLFNWITYY